MDRKPISIGDLVIGTNGPFFVIAGPCVIENEETTFRVADFLRETSDAMDIRSSLSLRMTRRIAPPWPRFEGPA